MKALIITEGGRNIGFGHITRCLSLCDGFIARQIKAELIIDADKSISVLLAGRHYKILNWRKDKIKLLKFIRSVDIIVIDSYLADKSVYEGIAVAFSDKLLAMIDDYKRLDYPNGIVINPCLCADKLNYPRGKGRVYLLGERYALLRRCFWDVPDKKIKKEIKDILITFGGQDRRKFIERILRYLRLRFSGFNYHVVMPGLSSSGMRDLMLKCDIAIAGGGQTTYELARCGLPTIGICFADNQIPNLKALHNKGFLEYIGRYNDSNILDKLLKAIESLWPAAVRKLKAGMGRRLVDGKGVMRVSANLAAIAMRKNKHKEIWLRAASESDCYDLWRWRNHPVVRRQSFNKERIGYGNHKAWFENKIKSNRCRIYIAVNSHKEKIGQVRFDFNGRRAAYINVNLNPKFFAKRLGNKIIRRATEAFKQEYPEVKQVIARVIGDNIASKKAFQKAGYVYQRNIVKDNNPVTIFKSI